MIYLSLATNVALAALLIVQLIFTSRELQREREYCRKRESDLYEQQRHLLNRIQAPAVAVAESYPEPEEQAVHIPVDDSPFADAMWDNFVEETRS